MKPCSLLCAVVLVLATVAGRSTAGPGAPKEGRWTLSWLELEVTLIPDEKDMIVDGVMTLTLKDDSADRLSLGINSRGPTMKFTEVTASADAEVKLNVPHVHNFSLRTARLDFASPLSRGDEVEVEFSYTSGGRQSSQFCVDPRIACASWVESWYPVPVTRSFAAGPYQVASHTVGERVVEVYRLGEKSAS